MELRQKVLVAKVLVAITLAAAASCGGRPSKPVGSGAVEAARTTDTPVSWPSTTTTTKAAIPPATRATVDTLLAKVVASTSVWRGVSFRDTLAQAVPAKEVLSTLEATYEAIGRLPSDVPPAVSAAARVQAVYLWTRIWAEFECSRVEDGYTSDTTGCERKDNHPEPLTLAANVIDLLAPFSDMSSADWVASLSD